MSTVDVHSTMRYEVHEPTSFAFSVTAARTDHQFVTAEEIVITPDVAASNVPFGSGTHQLLRFDAEPGELEITYRASVSLEGDDARATDLDEVDFGQIPGPVLPYLNPSRYCESDLFIDLASRLFGDLDRGHGRVQAVADWVEDNLVYEPGVTDGSSGTSDVLQQRAGVCRDFAHVSISLCRALGIPARYVSGYGVGVEPQDFHGFFEAYLGDDWYLFDPTGMSPINGLARIGFGRDAADTPFATFVGEAELLDKTVSVELDGDAGDEPDATSTA
ncbi:transglutaminase-like domain-containing protein [Ilumatobacter nonamiensis]|uniref:transglutaminase-like domain-containing protein n=1 Tax=Ilumatobacter nonamiensis TaxID=467093 RepID=UPI00034A3A85|nr:transglutaminase family protein [Ilumatobacter nonamiensis]